MTKADIKRKFERALERLIKEVVGLEDEFESRRDWLDLVARVEELFDVYEALGGTAGEIHSMRMGLRQ